MSHQEKIREVIDRFADPEAGSYYSYEAAQRVVIWLKDNDPGLLDGWLHEQAVQIVRNAITSRDRSIRARARTTSGSVTFQRAVEAHEAGDLQALSGWLNTVHEVNSENLRKRLADMGRDDLFYASRSYAKRARTNKMMATFLVAVAKRIGDGRVEDYYSDEQLASMWSSLRAQ